VLGVFKMDPRLNISFDQVLNMARKDERDFILRLLEDQKRSLVEEQNFTEAAAISDVVKRIKDHMQTAHIPSNNASGERVRILENALGAIGRVAMKNSLLSIDWAVIDHTITSLKIPNK